MNPLLKSLADKATDARELARTLTESGVRSIKGHIESTNLFSALRADEVENLGRDETHYVLVPLLKPATGQAIYTKRILPPGTGPTNSLPKVRVFHVPDVTGRSLLEEELIRTKAGEMRTGTEGESGLAEALESAADQIDRETSKMSGGILLIGGAIALVNPVVGLGLAAKALLPSLGTRLTRKSARFLGGKLRKRQEDSLLKKHEKTAREEVRRLKPVIFSNPVLQSLEAVVENPETDYDPALDRRNWPDSFEPRHYYQVTVEALSETLAPGLREATRFYQGKHLTWLESLAMTDT